MEKVPKLNYGDKYKATSFNNHKNELSNFITSNNIELDENDNTQFWQSILKSNIYDIYCLDSGSNGNLILSQVCGKILKYFPGLKVIFKPNSVPTNSSTLSLNGMAPKPVINV